MDSKLGRIDSN